MAIYMMSVVIASSIIVEFMIVAIAVLEVVIKIVLAADLAVSGFVVSFALTAIGNYCSAMYHKSDLDSS